VDRDEILRVLRAFEASGLEYGLVRATEDIDLFIRPTTENVERLRTALRAAYDNDSQIEQISAGDLLAPERRLVLRRDDSARRDGQLRAVEAETKLLEGTRVRVATPLALYRLKRATVRARDREDAATLRERFGLKDEA
jgi:hypothetical protein